MALTSLKTASAFPRQAGPALLALALLAGCAVGPDFQAPEDALSAAVLAPRHDSVANAALIPAPVPEQWWRLFGDETLNQLQARAAQGNLDLQAAASRIAQSRARAGIADAAALPRVGAGASVMREAASQNGRLVAMGAGTDVHEYWRAGLDAGWELDLWGRVRRLREGAGAALQASLYDQEGVRVAVSAELAAAYFRLRGAQADADTAGRLRDTAAQWAALVRSRRHHGVSTHQDMAAAQAHYDAMDARVARAVQRRDALLNALALLVGQPPRTLDAELALSAAAPARMLALPIGLPSELARRRPDIQQAEARLRAATAAIGVAQADFYPRIELVGAFGTEAFDGADLGNWASRQFFLGPVIYLPIFEGGRLRARLALSQAHQQEAAIAYRSTVLKAWHEIDDALDAWAAQRQRQDALRHAYTQQWRALQYAGDTYRAGAADRLALVQAEQAMLSARLDAEAADTAAALAVVGLYKALGGGWPARPAPVADASLAQEAR
ncbi:efflux transporter outer membrane subunit [Bordetella sp. BOR01]|uniref:efflux transporter outer membrane subunit n=1 Tax=Bordetella sp. BOR01 TaxID=2854779 RepID=UPI001C486A6B|nr:efflux transporter outer membrane subunit [Bordetella sp. BOR01]MBV7483952.1 efflux transporter outer membrane subunit [Bordetella sp. BOR01]